MTTPAGLASLVQEDQTDEAAAFERQVADDAVGDTDDSMAAALAAAAALWMSAFGSTTAVGAGAQLTKLLRSVSERIARALSGLGDRARKAVVAALPGALALGSRQAREFLRAAGQDVADAIGVVRRAPSALLREAAQLDGVVREQLSRAQRLLAAGGDRFSSVAAAVQVARTAVSRARAAVAWLVHRGVQAGGNAVAADLRLGRLWIAELDACVRCAAYSGQTAGPDEPFESGLSFDPQQKGRGPETVEGPPLHPHCRCRAVPWIVGAPQSEGLPDLLRRQAEQAIGEGWALPSESGAARVRAARSLLASGRRLPPRVAAKAQAAVAAGRFPPRPAR